VALDAGASAARRVDNAVEIEPEWFESVATVGVTSGASVPESLVDQVLDRLAELGYADVQVVTAAEESLVFSLPQELRRDLKSAERQ
jgi:4-hydroxy-3-methylbut-2-enyl diphosphate reductase